MLNLGKLFVTIAISGIGMSVAADSGYPRLQLDNGEIAVSIFLPDAKRGYYRGTRFDWSGIIERVDYRGHRFYSPLHETHDPLRHDAVSGPADEFAMFEPMGFAEAEAGESFVKIGVGLLAKGSTDEYQFHGDYELLRAGEWRIKNGAAWVVFEQDLVGERGWAYRYRKSIRLTPGQPEFVIEYRLENSGDKTIDINHYNHNFTLIDGTPYGPDYSVELALSTEQAQSINELAWFRGNRIEVEQPLVDKSLWIQLYQGEGRVDYNAATVRNNRTGAAVAFSGSAPVERFVFWAVERAACPEPFTRIYLPPGEIMTWWSRYRFSSGND
jgi:hypothetical protein